MGWASLLLHFSSSDRGCGGHHCCRTSLVAVDNGVGIITQTVNYSISITANAFVRFFTWRPKICFRVEVTHRCHAFAIKLITDQCKPFTLRRKTFTCFSYYTYKLAWIRFTYNQRERIGLRMRIIWYKKL